ncbi:MAG: hypothetical protein IPG04_40265 [Polyangiaceae bacterium]|nr:hypothetical protein [Polyangiaceae bacterium]
MFFFGGNSREIAVNTEKLQIDLTLAEALVLYEWLIRAGQSAEPPADAHQAERDVLLRLEAQLEKQLPQLFAENYEDLVARAREEVEAEGRR